MSAVFVKTFEEPPVNRREALRYAGAVTGDETAETLLDECLALVQGRLDCRVCWARFPVARTGDGLDLSFAVTDSKALARNLENCGEIILFAATVGVEMDRLIARHGRLSPARGHMLQAVGAERIESLCDVFNEQIRRECGPCRPRFSPGYGDLPLAIQRDVMRALGCQKHIGVTLNESLLMSPGKSVTAIIGLGGGSCHAPSGCAACAKTDCTYRREA